MVIPAAANWNREGYMSGGAAASTQRAEDNAFHLRGARSKHKICRKKFDSSPRFD